MFDKRVPKGISLAATLGLIAGLTVTGVMFAGLRRLEHDKIDLDFRQRAHMRIAAVTQELDQAVQILRVLNQSFATFGPVSREQFGELTHTLLQRTPYIQAFNFHKLVPGTERAAYEESMKRIQPDYAMREMDGGKLVPARKKDMHVVVDYIEPRWGNEAALGLDVSTNVEVMRVMQKAGDSGRATSTGLLQLAQGDGKRNGFLVVMPVYRSGILLDSTEARRQALIGDTASVIIADQLIGKVLNMNGLLSDAELGIRVYASEALNDKDLVFRLGDMAQADPASSVFPHWLFYNQPASIIRTFDVAGRNWTMAVSPKQAIFSEKHSASLYTLVAGILISLLVAAYLQAQAFRSQRVRRTVDQRTAELRLTNELLIEDIAARKRAEQALQLRERAIEASANAIIITAADGPDYAIQYVNPAFERITGYAEEEVLGRSCSLLWHGDAMQAAVEEFLEAARTKSECHIVLRNTGKSGAAFWADIYMAPVKDADGGVNHFVIALYDITATKRYEAELEFQANRDTLTGLANRNLLHDRLFHATAYAERYGSPVWLVFINLDRFKFVNDTLGHKAGDQLLRKLAERLQAQVRDTDTVARLGSDEFVLVLPERMDEALTPNVVQRIMDAIARPLQVEGYEFVTSCSAGIAVYPADGRDPETLIKHAGIAMYRAKETGRDNFQFYTPAMNERALERLRIEGDLRNALERNEFELHYQPQIDMRTGRIIGMEALIRWQHPVFGTVAPNRFIGLAEETGLIVPIGAWVLREACRQNMAWQEAGLGKLRVAVNLSARQFYQLDLVESIEAILCDTGLAPSCLEIEITESMMMSDVEQAVDILRKLKALGIQLSIDDFGTGYSSLNHLKRFPIDLLKIDKSFVRDISVNPRDAAIVQSIIALAHSLRLKVIAEGVEHEAELLYLSRHGCDYMQGYYFMPPLPVAEFEQMLVQRKSLKLIAEGWPRSLENRVDA